jgi:hypothetical protein
MAFGNGLGMAGEAGRISRGAIRSRQPLSFGLAGFWPHIHQTLFTRITNKSENTDRVSVVRFAKLVRLVIG